MSYSSLRPLIDGFGRRVTYLRLSVTDRCDLRCTYCMAEHMTFLPKRDLLTLEELQKVAEGFIARGVRKVRITGGEPLVRKGIIDLFHALGQQLGHGLDELTLTTNGTHLARHAEALYGAGVRRVNVSIDSIDPENFQQITRRGSLPQVLDGIAAAQAAGLSVKLNTVALKHQNTREIPAIIEWAHARDIDVTLIEVMPLGDTGEDRVDQYIPLPDIRRVLEQKWHLTEEASPNAIGGPARYARIAETGGRVGFITPLTHNFCASCNRVRVTCTGRIYMCLGQDDHVDLRDALRSETPEPAFNAALDRALGEKPERHDFEIKTAGAEPAVSRHMSMTGG